MPGTTNRIAGHESIREIRAIRGQLLLNALRFPEKAVSYSLSEWDSCIRMARYSRLLGRLSFLLEEVKALEKLHPKVNDHLYAARAIAAQHERIVRWEVRQIEKALAPIGIPIILLKGAAYVMAGLPPARGRLYSDVDILVPFDRLRDVELELVKHGWEHTKLKAYDQRYFRKWMHELPPLQHRERQSSLDVHHTILPRTGRLHPDPQLLLDAAALIDNSNLKILCAADMVLHSAAHLFQDGELAGGLRDLIDLDDLLRHFADTQASFWTDLIARAKCLDLGRPLFYALRYSNGILGTPIPASIITESAYAASQKPVLKLMDSLVPKALISSEPLADSGGAAFARWCLYARSHYLKMPPLLLAFHLFRKALMRAH